MASETRSRHSRLIYAAALGISHDLDLSATHRLSRHFGKEALRRVILSSASFQASISSSKTLEIETMKELRILSRPESRHSASEIPA